MCKGLLMHVPLESPDSDRSETALESCRHSNQTPGIAGDAVVLARTIIALPDKTKRPAPKFSEDLSDPTIPARKPQAAADTSATIVVICPGFGVASIIVRRYATF
jgi:hypothetical protein